MPLADTPLQRLKDAFVGTSTTDPTANPALRTLLYAANGMALLTGAFTPATTAPGVLDVLPLFQHNTTLPTYTDGQFGQPQMGTKGSQNVSLYAPSSTVAIANLADNADGVAATATASRLGMVNRNTIYSPTAWDLVRSVVNATNSTGTGITAAGILAQLDDTSPGTVTENQFGNLRMSVLRQLYVEHGGYSVTRVTADAQIKATAGFVHLLAITSYVAVPTAGLLTLYDSAAESGTVLYSEWITTGIQGHTILLDVPCGTGIYISYDASLANVQATVVWR